MDSKNYITLDDTEFFGSPHFIDNKEIYEISFGTDPKNDMRYTVGRKYVNRSIEVDFIEYDHNSFLSLGQRRISIWATNDQNEQKLWKISENQPCMITCKI